MAYARDQLDREKGMTAELEEVVVDADGAARQDLLVDRDQQRFGGVAGGGVGGRARRWDDLLQREGPTVELAARRDRQGIENDEFGRHHVFRQTFLQVRPDPGDQVFLDLRPEWVIGVASPVVLRFVGLGRIDALVLVHAAGIGTHPLQQDGVTAVRAVLAPADRRAVAQLLSQFPDVLRLDAVQRRRRGQPTIHGIRTRLTIEPAQAPRCRLDASVGHPAQPESIRLLLRQCRTQAGKRQTRHRPVQFRDDRRLVRRCRGQRLPHVQHDLVPEQGHLVAVATALQANLHPVDEAGTGGPVPEEGRVEGQLLFPPYPFPYPLPELLTRRRPRRAVQLHVGVERLDEGKAAHIADDDAAAGPDSAPSTVQDPREIADVGEILDDRVDDDRVERRFGQVAEFVGGALQQRDRVAKLRHRVKAPAHGAQHRRREVGSVVAAAFAGERNEQQAGAAPDLQNRLRLVGAHKGQGVLSPGLHLLDRNGLAGVTAVPARVVGAVLGGRRLLLVERLVDLLPMLQALVDQRRLFARDRGLGTRWIQYDVADEGGVAQVVFAHQGRRDLHRRVAARYGVDLTKLNAVSPDLDL